jgi:drug/metabolite transporter (DMT)-like permease
MAGPTSRPHVGHPRIDGRGVALCLASAFGFGCMAIFATDAHKQHLGISALLALRFTLAALIFWAIAGARRVTALPPRRILLSALGLGAFGYAAQSGLFFAAVKRMDASTTSLLLYTYPAMVFIAALALRREHADRRRIAALLLACVGTALVLLGGDAGAFESVGVVMAIGAAVAYTAYILVADTVVGKLDPFLLSALVTTGGAATFLVAGLADGGIDVTLSAHGWLDIAGIVLVSTILPVSTFLLGLERVGASTASIVSCFEPVVTVSLAMILYGERLGPGQLAGGALVLGAVVVLQARRSKVRGGVPPALASGPAPARALSRDAA